MPNKDLPKKINDAATRAARRGSELRDQGRAEGDQTRIDAGDILREIGRGWKEVGSQE